MSVMSRLEHKLPPPVVALFVAFMMWGVARFTGPISIAFGLRLVAALVLVGTGLAIAIAGIVQFRRAGTTTNPFHPDAASSLVDDGIYRFTRNPMYLGMLLTLLGWAAFLASPMALVLTPLFVLYMNRFQIGPEERALSARFGAAFDAYTASVRRWL
jgi:protein-S-isoprenylcysteine O-methyltransferase Ste14